MAGHVRGSQPSPTFGDLLRHYRIAATLSQEELAGRAGLSARAISDLERGTRRRPYPQTVRALADALRLDAAGRESLAAAARAPGASTPPSRPPVQTRAGAELPPIPVSLTPLIGRERERAELGQLLRRAGVRLVTLTGPGGVGKTRLALAVAGEALGEFPDGVAFVDLSSLHEPALVLPTIAQALDVREPGGRPSVDGLSASLRAKRLLLVLDNFEQVVAAAPALPALLVGAPEVRVLVTSRVALRVNGEIEYAAPGLALPEPEQSADPCALLAVPAVELFVRRAQDVRPQFDLFAGNAAAVAEICRRLDGLPLAIELAAARIKVLTPAAMLARLDQPLALLAGGRRDLPVRQQTIRATIAWSHDLLSPAEQRLLRRLSVFVGGWTIEAAEAVLEPVADGALPLGIATLDGLASLTDKTFVTHRELSDGDARFAMLETIREFGAERLAAAGEQEIFRDRHAGAILAFAERATPHLEGADVVLWLTRLDREDGNLRAALSWLRDRGDVEGALQLVVALRPYWFMRGRLTDGCVETLAVAALPGSAAFPALRVDALNSTGFFAREYGDFERAQTASAEALTESEQLGDRKRAADALANLGYVALQRGAFDEARDLLGACLDANRVLGNQQGIADALSFLGLIAFYARDLPTARRLNEESLAIWQTIEDVQAVVWARTRLGEVLMWQGERERAFRELMTSLDQARELDFWWGYSWAFDGLAQLAAAGHAAPLAITLAVEAEVIRERVGLLLPPAEQAEVDRLRQRLERELGPTAIAEAHTRRGQRSLDDLIQTIRDTLGSGQSAGPGVPRN
jgi:predicted ATPase/DNA-binding XRE family transcriptional regulator